MTTLEVLRFGSFILAAFILLASCTEAGVPVPESTSRLLATETSTIPQPTASPIASAATTDKQVSASAPLYNEAAEWGEDSWQRHNIRLSKWYCY